jgi:hypothetical protein
MLFAASAIVGCLGLIWHDKHERQVAEGGRRDLVRREMSKIEMAAFDYFLQTRSWPQGDNATVIGVLNKYDGALTGRLRLSERGAALDPWGTPYSMSVSENDGLSVHSAGPDRILGTIDDWPRPRTKL